MEVEAEAEGMRRRRRTRAADATAGAAGRCGEGDSFAIEVGALRNIKRTPTKTPDTTTILCHSNIIVRAEFRKS